MKPSPPLAGMFRNDHSRAVDRYAELTRQLEASSA